MRGNNITAGRRYEPEPTEAEIASIEKWMDDHPDEVLRQIREDTAELYRQIYEQERQEARRAGWRTLFAQTGNASRTSPHAVILIIVP